MHNKKFGNLLLAFMMALAVMILPALATDGEVTRFYGTAISLLPPLVAIGLALVT